MCQDPELDLPAARLAGNLVTLRMIKDFRERLMVKRILTSDEQTLIEELGAFNDSAEAGTPVVYLRDRKWILRRTPGQ